MKENGDMRYANIKYCDIANGEGVRTSLFVSGCTHHCEGCFNPETWDFNYGEEFNQTVIETILKESQYGYVNGITILGGEPMEKPNQPAVLELLRQFKRKFPNKTIWLYSGYTLEQLTGKEESRCRTEYTDEILSLLDVLVDGPWKKELYDVTLQFRGSRNQRLINMKETLSKGEIVLHQIKNVSGIYK